MSFIEMKRIDRLEYLLELSKSNFGLRRLKRILSRDNELRLEFNEYKKY